MKDNLVYWLLDEQENVIYVGSTSQRIQSRVGDHRRARTWWPSVASVAYTDDMTREDARRIEREDIFDLQPRYNVADRYGMTAIQIAQACSQISRRLAKAPA